MTALPTDAQAALEAAPENVGYEDGRTNREPRAWEIYPRTHGSRAAYRKGYMRGWREHMEAPR
jgi:hypothetical protein